MTRLTDGDRAVRAITEKTFQRSVVDMARGLGWGVTLSARRSMLGEAASFKVEPPPLDGLIFHPQYSLGSEPGWPDLTLVRRRDRRLIFAELKAEKGVLSVRQVEVLDLLREIQGLVVYGDDVRGRIEVHVWRPSDLDAIAEVLR